MRFRGSLTIPPGTTFNSPVTAIMILDNGVISQAEIMFPAGSSGLAHLAIDHYGHQILPTSPDESFIGDDQTISMSESYPMSESPYTIKLRGWAPTATLSHTVYVEITISPPPIEASLPDAAVAMPKGFTP